MKRTLSRSLAVGLHLTVLAGVAAHLRAQRGTTGRRLPAATRSASKVVLTVPDIRVNAAPFTGGAALILSQHADRPTILYAMAAWCGSCMPEAQVLIQLKRELGDQCHLVVVDIDPNDTLENRQGFAKVAGGAVGVWTIDTDGSITRPYKLFWLHTTVVIAGGREVQRSLHGQSLDQLRTLVHAQS